MNITAPEPLRNLDVVRALARTVHRPAVVPVPAIALRLTLGEFAGDILGGQRVLPARLRSAGFTFEHADIATAAAAIT